MSDLRPTDICKVSDLGKTMEKKRTRQINDTRQRIRKALLEMLKTADMNHISIRELCQKAGINRTTFYNHYGSQYDVLKDMQDSYLADITAALSGVHPSDQAAVHRQVELVLKYMEDHLVLSRLLLDSSPSSGFAETLLAIPGINVLLEHSLPFGMDGNLREAVISFAISGSWKMLSEWIHRDERIPAEQEAQLILMLAGRVCH